AACGKGGDGSGGEAGGEQGAAIQAGHDDLLGGLRFIDATNAPPRTTPVRGAKASDLYGPDKSPALSSAFRLSFSPWTARRAVARGARCLCFTRRASWPDAALVVPRTCHAARARARAGPRPARCDAREALRSRARGGEGAREDVPAGHRAARRADRGAQGRSARLRDAARERARDQPGLPHEQAPLDHRRGGDGCRRVAAERPRDRLVQARRRDAPPTRPTDRPGELRGAGARLSRRPSLTRAQTRARIASANTSVTSGTSCRLNSGSKSSASSSSRPCAAVSTRSMRAYRGAASPVTSVIVASTCSANERSASLAGTCAGVSR